MKRYHHLAQDQRYQIWSLKKTGMIQEEIAKEIGVNPSTVSRELKRNRGFRGYRPKQAHDKATQRKKKAAKAVKMTEEVIRLVESKIREEFSPEQVSGWLLKEHGIELSHERIYQHIWADKRNGGDLYKHLRHSNKKRKKRYGSKDRRGQIKNRISIDERPGIVDRKERIGDWEIDTVIGRNHKGALLTIVERRSKFTTIARVENRRAETVTESSLSLLHPYAEKVKTITADNGKEFAGHETISKRLGTSVYFAHPYHSWERGLNENTNGLIRQYFPKGMCFDNITDDDVKFVMNRLNHRPRKTLGFLTPHEVFIEGKLKEAA